MSEAFKVLVIFAHPNRDQSRVHTTLLNAIQGIEGVTIVDLYNEYPDYMIDVKKEQKRVSEHELLIFQHPIYWYSCPPLLKEWLDCVLEQGWAYGEGGDKTLGLDFLQVLSSGGPNKAYSRAGYNRFTVHELMRPFEATANLCGWRYHKPLLLQGVGSLDKDTLEDAAKTYRELLHNYRRVGREILDALDTATDTNVSF